ncbi:MAG: serine/threonine-protein kinase [Pirellulales bacterium]
MKNRLSRLDSTCSADASSRRRLAGVLEDYLADLERGVPQDEQALLAAHPDLADELRPYLDSLQLLHGAARDMRAAKTVISEAGDDAAGQRARQIGDYRIVREIGRGGMGIVYEAHQKSLNRRVALKILPFAAVLDQRQIARFRNEAQAAAQLHHPHIVPVFAVGQEQGVYYYAMQHIDGQSLEQVIAELRKGAEKLADQSTQVAGAANGSTTTEHLVPASAPSSPRSIGQGDFFRTVARLGKESAEALQHAHEHGILHRDVKPSNLLVDERGKLWVTDFGLARMQTDSGMTMTGDVVGTLRYMSPEQAAGRTALVDARTDVYSLGATLYELLTQRQAHPGDDRQSLLRQIVEVEPIRPRRLNPAVPIDLETIVLGAMAKSRDERYASAQALADDLERFLSGKPTLARRPTIFDRTAKWARRHRSLVAVAAAALVLLTLVSAVGMALLVREQARTSAALTDAKASAQTAHQSVARAERHFRQARGAVDQLGMRLADRLLEIPGAESLRRDFLVDTLGYYRQFAAEADNDPQLRNELALAHFKSGVITAKLGAAGDALVEYEAARGLLAQLAAAEPTKTEPRAQLAVTHNNIGLLLAARGDVERARQQYDQAIEIQKRLVDENAGGPAFAGSLAETQANLGMLLDQLGDFAEAEKSLRAAVDLLRPLAESRGDVPKYARNLAIACNNLSFVLRGRDADAAQSASREAIAILEQLAEQAPSEVAYLDDLALCYNNLAALEGHKAQVGQAIDWHQRAIAIQEQLVRKAPAVVRYRSDLAVSLNNLGVAYCRAAQTADADAVFGRARELLGTLAGDYPDEIAYSSSLAALLNNQALALAGAGRNDDALEIYPTAIEAQRKCYERLKNSAMMRELLSKMIYNYGQSLRNAGRPAEAAQAALSRREAWQGNGERLFGVAVELAALGDGEWNDDVIATLRQACEHGWSPRSDLAADERFAYLHNQAQFAALVAELNGRAADSKVQSSAGDGWLPKHPN